jgi:hypothetical protein
MSRDITPSGWRDLNPRPLRPERSTLPSCATPRSTRKHIRASGAAENRAHQSRIGFGSLAASPAREDRRSVEWRTRRAKEHTTIITTSDSRQERGRRPSWPRSTAPIARTQSSARSQPELLHHPHRAGVRPDRDRDQPIPAEHIEGDIAAHQGRLGGEAATPRVPGQPPADLHLVGQQAMVRQTAEAEQLSGLSRGNGVQPVSACLPCALGLPEDRVTLSAGSGRPPTCSGDLRIGVDLSERRPVSRLPCPQDQPSRLDPGRDVASRCRQREQRCLRRAGKPHRRIRRGADAGRDVQPRRLRSTRDRVMGQPLGPAGLQIAVRYQRSPARHAKLPAMGVPGQDQPVPIGDHRV